MSTASFFDGVDFFLTFVCASCDQFNFTSSYFDGVYITGKSILKQKFFYKSFTKF